MATVIIKKIDQIRPYGPNARNHPEPQIEALCKAILCFGFTKPILIDSAGVIIAGHGAFLAAQRLKIAEVPCIVLRNLSPEKIRAYRLVDNKLADLSTWDRERLNEELFELCNFDLDLSAFGFDIPTEPIADLSEEIFNEVEFDAAQARAEDIQAIVSERMEELATAAPDLLNRALGVVLPAKKGSRELFVLADPNTADVIAELRRYAEDGQESPLQCLLNSVFSMRRPDADSA